MSQNQLFSDACLLNIYTTLNSGSNVCETPAEGMGEEVWKARWVSFCWVNLIVRLLASVAYVHAAAHRAARSALLPVYTCTPSRVKSALTDGLRWQCKAGLPLSPDLFSADQTWDCCPFARWLWALAESEENLTTQRRFEDVLIGG